MREQIGMTMKESTRKTLSVSAGGVLALGLGALCFAQVNTPSVAVAQDAPETLTTQEAASISPLYAEAQGSQDRLPAFLVSGEQSFPGIVPDSSRFLATVDENKVWTVLDDGGEVCIITLMPGPDQFATQGCVTPERFAEAGVSLQASDETDAYRVHFVPEGYVDPAGQLDVAEDQLLVGDPSEASGPTELVASDGAKSTSEVVLPPMSSVAELAEMK